MTMAAMAVQNVTMRMPQFFLFEPYVYDWMFHAGMGYIIQSATWLCF